MRIDTIMLTVGALQILMQIMRPWLWKQFRIHTMTEMNIISIINIIYNQYINIIHGKSRTQQETSEKVDTMKIVNNVYHE